MIRLIPLVLLAACTAPVASDPLLDAPALPADQAAPPPRPANLTASPAVAGAPLNLQVTGVPVGARVTFVATANVTAPGLCPPAIAPACLAVPAGFITLGSATVGGSGVAGFTVTVPNPAPPRIEIQAYAAVGGGVFYLTNGVLLEVLPPNGDADNDGLTNAQELPFGTDPRNPDTDADRLSDGTEVAEGTDPRSPDTDNDGLEDGDEFAYGTNPFNPDTDGDGVTDGDEIALGTVPTDADTDDDGLSDGDELLLGTDPTSRDPDGDGLWDGDELAVGTDPYDPDTDLDMLLDGIEVGFGTDPLNRDTDGDGLFDGDEDYTLDGQVQPGETDPRRPDSDEDGLSDGLERGIGTDPLRVDTDGGGVGDGEEWNRGTNPLNPNDDIIQPPMGGLVINEVDYDQAGTDTRSFIEIFNTSSAPIDLLGKLIVLLNGGNSAEYARYDLGQLGVLNPGQFAVIGNATVVVPPGTPFIAVTGDFIQNGAPDGIALVDWNTFTVLDRLSYEGAMNVAQINGWPGPIDLVEGAPFVQPDTNDDLNSIARVPNGIDTDVAALDWRLTPVITPGAPNF